MSGNIVELQEAMKALGRSSTLDATTSDGPGFWFWVFCNKKETIQSYSQISTIFTHFLCLFLKRKKGGNSSFSSKRLFSQCRTEWPPVITGGLISLLNQGYFQNSTFENLIHHQYPQQQQQMYEWKWIDELQIVKIVVDMPHPQPHQNILSLLINRIPLLRLLSYQ